MKVIKRVVVFFGIVASIIMAILVMFSGGVSNDVNKANRAKERLKKRRELNEKRSIEDLKVENDSDLKDYL